MTTQLISNYFRLHNINQFRESISETANSVYYIFAGKHTEYSGGDTAIPDIVNDTEQTFYSPYEEMIFGKRVGVSDVCAVTKRYNWTSNTTYAAYRETDDLTNKQFYVCVDGGVAFHVFKCLDNNANAASVIPPNVTQTSPDDEYYSTSDGYVWKYMYSVDATTFNKFATDNYMPVVANNEVVGNAVSGSIDTIVVTYPGSNYNTTLSSTFISSDLRVGGNPLKYNIANTATASNNFYTGSFLKITDGTGAGQGKRVVDYVVIGNTKTVTLASAFDIAPDSTSLYEITPYVYIVGDGDGAEARAIVNTSLANSISHIEIVNRGNNYTWATAVVTGNTSGVTNTAVLGIVRPPKGGHGSNPEYELGASGLCISVSFANNETGTIPTENDFRSVGLLKDPLYSNVVFTVGSPSGAFGIGELVTQANTNATGIVTEWDSISTLSLTNVSGIFMTGNSSVNYLTGADSMTTASVTSYQINGESKNFNTFDQRFRYSFTPIVGEFIADETVYQTDIALSNAVFHSNTSANIYLTHIKGTLNTGNTIIGVTSSASANLLYAYPPDLVVGSGEVLYVENESPISRSNNQTETIKIILQF